jgi:hypothetical protein
MEVRMSGQPPVVALRMGFTETGEVRSWRYDKLESESILMDKRLPPGVG